MALNFKEEFFSLATKYLGGNSRTLQEGLGKYDEIEKYAGNSYLWFSSLKANFYVGNDEIVRWVYAPHAGAGGHAYLDNPNYYVIDGLAQGMSKDDVVRLWGKADWEAELSWTYNNKVGVTNTGQKINLSIYFEEEDSNYKLAYFEAQIPKNETVEPEKPKSGCFIATACYGNYDAYEVIVLRQFRDSTLLKSTLGKAGVNIYYFLSPPLARFIENSDILKMVIRKYLLNPIVSKINKTPNHQL